MCDEEVSLDLIVSQEAKGDMVVETSGALTVALDTQLTEELVQGWFVRSSAGCKNIGKTAVWQSRTGLISSYDAFCGLDGSFERV